MFPSTTTKQINVYGKRARRVIQISDENKGAVVYRETDAVEAKMSGTPRKASKPHIARTSTSPLTFSKHQSNQPPVNSRNPRQKNSLKKVVSSKALGLGRQPFTDVMNSPMAKRTTSDHFSKQAPKPQKPPPEVVTIEDSEEDSGSEPTIAPPRSAARRRVKRIVISDEESDNEDDEKHVPTPRISKARRRIVSTSGDEEEATFTVSGAQSIIDLTAEHSSSPNPLLTYQQPAPRKPSSGSATFSSSGNLFKQQGPSLHISKKRLPSTATQSSIRKVSKTQSLLKPFQDLTVDDAPPKNAAQRTMSDGVHGNFSPLKTRTQRKASHQIKVSPLRDSALLPPRNHRARVFSKNQKESPIRPSLLPAEEDKKKETKIVEVKAASKSRPPAPTVAPSRLPPTFEELLNPLLAECAQQDVMDFEFFVSTFPSDELFEDCPPPAVHSKIGEATYSEVFGCGNVVLKIVPLRNPEAACREEELEEELPTQSEIDEVEREIITTRALGEFSRGFVKLLRAFVVKGRYPKKLLSLWDKFDKQRGSENVRPSCFDKEQHYAIIVLPNGGPDLESYDFKKSKVHAKRPWFKACSIFWQVVSALERAEDLAGFEHRDLHWGQILVKDREPAEADHDESEADLASPHSTGVTVTIIDLGLVRMDDMGDDTKQRWTEFDSEIFEGEGDYQYDVYRMMKAHNAGEWGSYHPLTNVMWLHYILVKLLQAKRIRPPSKSRSKASSPSWSEFRSYDNLVEIEKLIEKALKTRLCRAEDPLRSAGDVWKLALKWGWASSNL